MPPFILWCRIIAAFVLGAGYAIGPPEWRSSPAFRVLNESNIPVQVWGWLFMTCAVLMGCTKIFGFITTVIVWSIWGMYLAAAPIGSLGAVVWPFFFVAVNGYEVAAWGQKRMQMVRNHQITSFAEVRRLSRERDRGRDER